jgi:hypothetical protein
MKPKPVLLLAALFLAATLTPRDGGTAELEFSPPEAPQAKPEKPKVEKPKPKKDRPRSSEEADDAETNQPASPSPRANLTTLGVFNNWSAFSYLDNGRIACYATSKAARTEPRELKRKDLYFLITHRPIDKTFYVAQAILGTTVTKHQTVVLSTPTLAFNLFADEDSAWARTAKEDREIAQSIAGSEAGGVIVVSGRLPDGNSFKDTYSLSGAKSALKAIDRACNVPTLVP